MGWSSRLYGFDSSRSAKPPSPCRASSLRVNRACPGHRSPGCAINSLIVYVDTSHAIVEATVTEDLRELEAAVRRLLQQVDAS